jgi:transposase-like protein
MSTMAETRSQRPRRRFTEEFKQQAVRLVTAEREELVRLRKALRIAEEERDILKKATAFFAKQSR